MSLRSILVLACLIAAVAANPLLYYDGDIEGHDVELESLIRHVRSPGDGSVQIDYNQDKYGKQAGVQYNQNVYKSNDGRLTVDAYARGSRDFTRNRNDYGGGVQGTYHFG